MGQVERLKEVIGGRDLGIVLFGPSVKELEARIKEFPEMCWASVNEYWSTEENILAQVGERYDIVMCSAKECLVPDKPHIEFLNRKDNNLFVTETVSIYLAQVKQNFTHPLKETTIKDFLDYYQEKIFMFHANRDPDALSYPNEQKPFDFLAQASFSMLVCLGVIGQARRIVLFGAEGLDQSDTKAYPGYPGRQQSRVSGLLYDTAIINQCMTQVLRNTCITYDATFPEIINCSNKSYYKPFRVVSYDECLSILKSNTPLTKAE